MVRMAIHTLLGMGFDSNVFLITGGHPFLVDTGSGENNARIQQWLESSLGGTKLERIILTHRHIDHIGGVAGLRKDHKVRVQVHHDDAEAVRTADPEETGAVIFGVSICPMEVEELSESEMISSGENSFRVIHTPGHSAGSICLFEEQSRSLICGDTVFRNGVGRWDLPSGDFNQLLNSIRSLKHLKIRNIYPGHGPCALDDGQEAVERALAYLGEY